MSERRPARPSISISLALAGLLIGGVALQAYRVGDPISGYMGWNEAYYLNIASDDVGRGLLAPVTAPADPYNPPLYPVLLTTALRLLGDGPASGRWLSILATAIAVLAVFGIGRRLYNDRVAIVAAACVAFAPGTVIVGRNIQTDALMLAMELLFVYAYLRAMSSRSSRWAALAGGALGLGLLVKLPVLLGAVSLAAWRTWRERGISWVRERETLWVVGVSAALALPWYLARLATSSAFVSAQGRLISVARVLDATTLWHEYLLEMAWMLGWAVALLGVLGLVLMVRERRSADRLVLCWVGIHAVVFLLYNYHTYYYLPLVPFASLAAGRFAFSAGGRRTTVAVSYAVVLAVLVGGLTFLMLCGKKYNAWAPSTLEADLGSQGIDPAKTTVLADDRLFQVYGPMLDRAVMRMELLPVSEWRKALPGNRALLLGELPDREVVANVHRNEVRPVLFGHAVGQADGPFNFFGRIGGLTFERVGPVWRFGVSVRQAPYMLWLYEAGFL